VVILDVETSDVTKNTTAATITSSALPKSLRPASVKYGVANVISNNVAALGGVTVGTNGVITVSNGVPGATFGNAQAGGFRNFTIMYDKRT